MIARYLHVITENNIQYSARIQLGCPNKTMQTKETLVLRKAKGEILGRQNGIYTKQNYLIQHHEKIKY